MIVAATPFDGALMASASVARATSSPTDSAGGKCQEAGDGAARWFDAIDPRDPETGFGQLGQLLGLAQESSELAGRLVCSFDSHDPLSSTVG